MLFVQPERALLDTADPGDARATGRDGPESWRDGTGLKIAYAASSVPVVTLNGPDGQIELCGVAEIRTVRKALERAEQMAVAFGPPRSWAPP